MMASGKKGVRQVMELGRVMKKVMSMLVSGGQTSLMDLESILGVMATSTKESGKPV